MAYEGSLCIEVLRAAYADGLDPAAVVEAACDRIGSVRGNPIWIHRVPRSEALARAQELQVRARQAGRASMPLFGIPFAVKDNIDVAGMPTTAACPDFAYVPRRSATVVEHLLDAGAILLGKTNLDQFATGLVGTRSPHGACRNAFDPAFVSGGSSAGSAVAVALDLVSFSLGTDTAGSGRVPAAFNNIVGIKPTPGVISTAGVVPACRSLDCVSIFAADAADALEVLDVATGFDARDPYSRPAGPAVELDCEGLRVAVPRLDQREFFGDREYAGLYESALHRVERLGARTHAIDFADFYAVQRLLYDGPWLAERIAGLDGFPERHPASLHPVTRRLFEGAGAVSGVDVFRGMVRLAELRRSTEGVWREADVLLVPGAPSIYRVDEVEASPIELNARLGTYTNFVNLLGLCAITVPAGFRRDGLPFGVTLIAPAWADRSLARVGAKLHAALGLTAGATGRRQPRLPAPQVIPGEPTIDVAVVGAHLSGLPLNGQLTSRGARLQRVVRTSRQYRFYALADGTVPRPGLVRVRPGEAGGAIEAEVWRMPVAEFGSFVAQIAPPLAIGTVELEDGSQVKGFVCEACAADPGRDITDLGGWRRYLSGLGEAAAS